MAAVARWLMLVLSVAACIAIAAASYMLADASWNGVVSYESPYASMELPESMAGDPHAETTVLVIIDGLRLDASRRMSTLNLLRSYGVDLELTVPQPSLSYPNWTTLLSGAPPHISGVVTNWHEGQAQVETLFDTAARSGAKTVFVGPADFETLYGIDSIGVERYTKPWSGEYLSGEYVDAAIRLAEEHQPRLLVLHLPDADIAGHEHGGTSVEYDSVLARLDMDLRRLVEALQGRKTMFVVASDHGHIDTGGHGGWEDEVVKVPGIVAGPRVPLSSGEAAAEQIAPTVAALAGLPAPRMSVAEPLEAIGDAGGQGRAYAAEASRRFNDAYAARVAQPVGGLEAPAILGQLASSATGREATTTVAARARMDSEREARLPLALSIAGASVLAVVMIGIASWRALIAALEGSVVYVLVYNALFFFVHDHRWSLSAFNSEENVQSWMNLRLVEAALAALIAVAVAAAVYPLLRRLPKGPEGRYLAGWLTLGPVTVLAILATLGVQIAWFVWAWGILPEWALPDLMWGFKYDLDLIQATAVGAVGIAAPLVSYLIGRYHPRVRPIPVEE